MEPERVSWMQYVRSLPIPEWHHECVVVGEKIFMVGYDDQLEFEELRVLIYNTESNAVHSILPTMQQDGKRTAPILKSFFAVAHHQNIYVCGHKDPNYFAACQIHCLNTETMVWTSRIARGDIPSGKLWGTASIIAGKIFILVDHFIEAGKGIPCVYALDLSTYYWSCESRESWPNHFTPRGTATFGNRIYTLFVNWTSFGDHDDGMAYYDTADGVWQWLEPPGFKPYCGPRWTIFELQGCLMAMISNVSLSLSGHIVQPVRDAVDEPHVILQYAPQANEWKQVRFWAAPSGRYFDTVAVVENKAFFFCSIFKEIYMIDFDPSLQSLCYQVICQYKLDARFLPPSLKKELSLYHMRHHQ